MARLTFVIICEDATLQNDNSLDITNCISQVSVKKNTIVQNVIDGKVKPIFRVVTSWMRSNPEKQETTQARLTFKDPDGKAIMQNLDMHVDLTNLPKSIFITSLTILPPLEKAGIYEIQVDLKSGSRWKTVGACPIEINLINPEQQNKRSAKNKSVAKHSKA